MADYTSKYKGDQIDEAVGKALNGGAGSVSSVNGQTGDVQIDIPNVPSWAMQSAKPTYTAAEVGALPSSYTPPNQTASQVGADPAGSANAAVSAHNTDGSAHNDIRALIESLTQKLNALADCDDATLDQMSEVVAYIKNNKSIIDGIATSKVNVTDIINNLTTNVTNKPLSAAQGVAIKKLIDAIVVPTKVSALENDTGYLDSSALSGAISAALVQAKESGEFKGDPGKDGKTPVKGTDYWTDEDKAEIKGYVDETAEAFGLAVSVKSLGAKGDNTTDDTAIFQAALANNRRVFVPGGSYKLSEELIIGNNCQLELAQDAVLYFEQTTGNCISLKMCSWLRGNHATISVPYAFTGNVINIDTGYTDDLYDTPPFKHWDPVWKPGRYVTDVNIIKPNAYNLCYSDNGECSGTAIHINTDGNDLSTFLWGVDLSGLRIAGAFTYGVYGITVNVNGDSGWNHDMKVSGLIAGCETGVKLTRVHKVYLATLIQPQKSRTGVAYAKNGIYLENCRYMNLINARTFDWNSNFTLWEEGNENQHIALIGDCSGLVLEDWNYYAFGSGYDIRSLIYTDTPSNLERMAILQEPITRWFKPKDGKPYFNDGDAEKRLLLDEEFQECFQVDNVPDFTDVLPAAINKDGAIFNGAGYAKYGIRWNLASGEIINDAPYYGCTGLIRVTAGDTIYVNAIDLGNGDDSIPGVVVFDANFERVHHGTAAHLVSNSMSYYFDYTDTDYGFMLTVKQPSTAAYVAFNFQRASIGENPAISINEPLTYSQKGFLADTISVNEKSLYGMDGYERKNRLVTSITSSSTDSQYPSAKAVYDAVQSAIGSAIGGSY